MIARSGFLLLLALVGCDSYRGDRGSSTAITSDNRHVHEECMRAQSETARTRCTEKREHAVWSAKGRGINLKRGKK